MKETFLDINLDNLTHNVSYLRSLLKKNTRFMAVVKANSYGQEAARIALHLESHALADFLAVAYAYEGVALRKAGVRLPILVLHPQEAHFQDIIDFNLEPTLYSERIISLFTAFLKYSENKIKTPYPVHLKYNSGMNRLGLSLQDAERLLPQISAEMNLKVVSAYSHLVASEDTAARDFILFQIESFKAFQNLVKMHFSHPILFHICNTSGILNYPEAHFDMVRSGIGMYGFANDAKLQKNFKPISTLKTIISQIHTIGKGDFVGYNFGFVSEKETMRTATISVGHADGISRIYGKEKGYVFIGGKKAPILGNVCMDMLMVDVSEIDCEEGDQVIIFDGQNTAEMLAESAGTISYELITALSRRIKR